MDQEERRRRIPHPLRDRLVTRCSHCNGWMAPSQFKDEPPACLLCGRSNCGPTPPTKWDTLMDTSKGVDRRAGRQQHFPVTPFSESRAYRQTGTTFGMDGSGRDD